ncbi:MAG: type I glutamate--ammonia ligase, partial [Firmicutes bacterium]|nr:type I glutamate--ammonia ligase [Bacillota bacterium]
AAVACMSESSMMQEALGEHVFRRFQDAKAQEWADYTSRITDWELEHYLSKF